MKKNKIWKRAGAVILSTALLFGTLPTGVMAEETVGQDTNEEELLSEEVVSEDEPAEEILPEEVSSEEDAAEMYYDTAEAESEVSESTGETDESETDLQYHFTDGDVASILTWKEQYFSEGYEQLLSQDESWWDGLYDYERDLAEFLVSIAPDISEQVYLGQDLEQCLEILDTGVSADEFFCGTVFEGLEKEDLQALKEEGYSLEALAETAEQMLAENSRAAESSITENEIDTQEETVEEALAKLIVSYTGYNGTGHGKIFKLTLGGQPAFCLQPGKSARTGYVYKAGEGEYEICNDGLGNLIAQVSVGAENYVSIQISIWLYQSSTTLSMEQVVARTVAMLNISSPEAADKMASNVWNYYQQAGNGSQTYYIYHSDNSNAQITGLKDQPELFKGKNPVEMPSESEVVLKINKTDWQTEVGLEGCMVDIFENGAWIGVVTTDEDGEATFTVKKSKEEFEKNTYTYSIREHTAPNGYVWEERTDSRTGKGGDTLEFPITNERTLGAVELVKYDTEAEDGIHQGDAILDGAVYGIYAAENIEHQDGVTGIIYGKDELVAQAVIGKSPKRNSAGYILNTDGSRHIENKWGTIAYEDTPGRTLFGDLELGTYYIKEIRPSEGYMFDEAVYDVTISYKDQMIKIEKRDETASEAQNELTVDDESTSHTIYSGDYVVKQGIEFIKTSDNTYQTELEVMEGAGFSAYLISDLSGVKNGSIQPKTGTWSEADIMTFYDYDFTKEPTAMVYKRTGHEEWTNGDKRWLEKVDGLNRYRVKEMFTDKNGRIITPEFPYGTYVFVETTTPEHHVAAKPFLAFITKDGGVVYTDATKQKIEKIYTVEEGIRYGNHAGAKAREGRELQKQRIINNTITKSFLRLVKADEEFIKQPGEYIKAEEVVRGTVLKEGASYRLRCLTMELSEESLIALNWKYDKDGWMSYYDPNAKEMTGTADKPFCPVFLKKDGRILDCYITLPQEVPIGTYELTELTAPSGYVVNGSEQTVTDISEGRENGYKITDTPQRKLTFTINNGSVYPDGQMGENKYAVCDQYGNLTVTVLQKNQEQKGILRLYKHGEQLAGTRSVEEANGMTGLEFVYQDAPVEGASFQIIAAENIYTQEVTQDLFLLYQADMKEYLIHKKGDVVTTINTDRYGWAYATNLYIGKYKIMETIAGDGFVLNQEVKEFEITPQEQTINFDIQSVQYKNERQRLQIEVQKKDKENEMPLYGAVFGLYVTEDIYTNIVYDAVSGKWIIRDVPVVTVPAGTFIKACVTGTDGKGIFVGELPLGKYEIKELTPPTGYLPTEETVLVDASYEGPHGGQFVQIQRHVGIFHNERSDKPTPVPETPKPDGSRRTHREEAVPVVPQPAPVESPTTGDSAPLLLLGLAGVLALLGIGMIGIVESRRRRTK